MVLIKVELFEYWNNTVAEMIHATNNNFTFNVGHLVFEMVAMLQEAYFDREELIPDTILTPKHFSESSFPDQIQDGQRQTIVLE